jgi:hypothetical protein
VKNSAFVALIALFLAVPATEATAQVTFGPQLVLFDVEDLGIGARVDFQLGDLFGAEEGPFSALFATANGNYVFNGVDNLTTLVFNGNAAVPFAVEAAVTPYAGAGLNLIRSSFEDFSDNSTGLNILGGVFFDLSGIPAFAELLSSAGTSCSPGRGASARPRSGSGARTR